MGHLMRTLAIAAVARGRGWSVLLIGDIDEAGSAAAHRIEPDLAIRSVGAAELPETILAVAGEVDVLHIDAYTDVPDVRGSGTLVSNMQDGPYGVREADLSIDANLGAEETFARPDLTRHPLAGLDVAVVREQVLRQRAASHRPGAVPRVLVVMGGSDPRGLTAHVVQALDGVPAPLRVTVIDPRDRLEVRKAAAASVHDVQVRGFVDDLPALAREHDLAVTAAGTSVWDFACMGVPMAVLCAVDNQRPGYANVVRRGLAVGLGVPPHADLEARVAELGALLHDGDALAAQSAALRDTVDGLGTWRIVASWEQLVDAGPDEPRPSSPISVRPATRDDVRVLYDWRNDEATRAHSRSSEALEWDSHVSWLDRTLSDRGPPAPGHRVGRTTGGLDAVGPAFPDGLGGVDHGGPGTARTWPRRRRARRLGTGTDRGRAESPPRDRPHHEHGLFEAVPAGWIPAAPSRRRRRLRHVREVASLAGWLTRADPRTKGCLGPHRG